MRLFNRPEVPTDPLARIKRAVDEINAAWDELKVHKQRELRSIRPWIIWAEKRMVLTRWQSQAVTIYDGEDEVDDDGVYT